MNTILQDGIFLKAVDDSNLAAELESLAEEFPDSSFVTTAELKLDILIPELNIDDTVIEELHPDSEADLEQIDTNFAHEMFTGTISEIKS